MTQRVPLRIALALGIAAAASACQTAPPVDRPCGIVRDALIDVQGTTAAFTRRIDLHVERGIAAGCWDRQGRLLR